jgi:hypothetical protein
MYRLDCIFNSFFCSFCIQCSRYVLFLLKFQTFSAGRHKLNSSDSTSNTFSRLLTCICVSVHFFLVLPFYKLIPSTLNQVPALFIIMCKVIKFMSSDYMVLDEKKTGTDPTNNPGPHSRRVADVPTVHAMAPTTEPCCVLDAGYSDHVSHPVATELNATGLH